MIVLFACLRLYPFNFLEGYIIEGLKAPSLGRSGEEL